MYMFSVLYVHWFCKDSDSTTHNILRNVAVIFSSQTSITFFIGADQKLTALSMGNTDLSADTIMGQICWLL